MPVTVILDMHYKPERIKEVLASLAENLPDTRAFDGCLSVQTVRKQEDPGNVSLIERWESKEHQQRYLAWRASQAGDPRLAEATTAPITFTWYVEEPEV
jgi:quinol monooxygenase YgiN